MLPPPRPTKQLCSDICICRPIPAIFPGFSQMLKRKRSETDEPAYNKKARKETEQHIDNFIMWALRETIPNQAKMEELVVYAQYRGGLVAEQLASSFLRRCITLKQVVWGFLSKLKLDYESKSVITIELEMRAIKRVLGEQTLMLDEGWVLVKKML